MASPQADHMVFLVLWISWPGTMANSIFGGVLAMVKSPVTVGGATMKSGDEASSTSVVVVDRFRAAGSAKAGLVANAANNRIHVLFIGWRLIYG